MERPCQARSNFVWWVLNKFSFLNSRRTPQCSRRSRPSRTDPAGTARSGQGRAVVGRGAANPCRRAPFWHRARFGWAAQGEHVPAGEPGAVFRTTAVPITAGKLARRLITLIYAGRNRMDMIRRELPRTDNAGWIRRSFRTILVEGSPFRMPSAVIGTAVVGSFKTSSCLCEFELRFGMYRNGPHETEQLASQRRHDLPFVFVARRHGGESFMQPLLRFPGDSFGFIAERQGFLSSQNPALHVGPMLIGPCRLHQNPSQMRIAGLRNRSAQNGGFHLSEYSRGTRPL